MESQTDIKDYLEKKKKAPVWEGWCSKCKKLMPHTELKDFTIPVRTCAVTHAITTGETIVYICPRCLKKYGVPCEIYIGELRFMPPNLPSIEWLKLGRRI